MNLNGAFCFPGDVRMFVCVFLFIYKYLTILSHLPSWSRWSWVLYFHIECPHVSFPKCPFICMWPDTDSHPCLMHPSLCRIHCESLLYNTCPFCCQVGGGGVCMCLCCASVLDKLPTLWPLKNAKYQINALSVNLKSHCVRWQGSQFLDQHANCVLIVQHLSYAG